MAAGKYLRTPFSELRDLFHYCFGRILLRFTNLFDAEWYEHAHPTIKRGSAAHHYLTSGSARGFAPSRAFDPDWYRDSYLLDSTSNPLFHYLLIGRWKGVLIKPSPPSDADLIKESGLFDGEWYYSRYPDVQKSGMSALKHFLAYGWRETRSPGPDFDALWYSRRYPDVADRNVLTHFISHGRAEGRLPVPLKVNLAVASKVIAEVEDLDPELYAANYNIKIEQLQITTSVQHNRLAFAFNKILNEINARPRVVIFAPWLSRGGADLLACHAAQTAAEFHGSESVVVVLTDSDNEAGKDRLPKNVSVVSFSALGLNLSDDDRVDLVELLVRALQPRALLNVNSLACWKAMKRRGRRMALFTKLYAMLFCPDYDAEGRPCGYSDLFLRASLPYLSGVYFDNETHITDIIKQYAVPVELQSRLVVLKQPSPALTRLSSSRKNDGRRLSVLWAGRIAHQKNIALLANILRIGQQFDFHVWGGASDISAQELLEEVSASCNNVQLHGEFERFDKLPVRSYDAFLYTSLWDGLPNVLLEAAAVGIPIIASDSGGIGELVNLETGWLVPSLDDAAAYISALQEVATSPEIALERAGSMQKKLKANYNWESYKTVIRDLPLEPGGFLNV
jgi:glycosyltransferase involved in cell wall biosynthesis